MQWNKLKFSYFFYLEYLLVGIIKTFFGETNVIKYPKRLLSAVFNRGTSMCHVQAVSGYDGNGWDSDHERSQDLRNKREMLFPITTGTYSVLMWNVPVDLNIEKLLLVLYDERKFELVPIYK